MGRMVDKIKKQFLPLLTSGLWLVRFIFSGSIRSAIGRHITLPRVSIR